MKILFVANRFPYPPFRGDKLKIWNLARNLSRAHELHLITFLENPDDAQYLPELRTCFRHIHLVPLPKWRSALSCLMALPGSMPLQVAYFKSAAFRKKLAAVLEAERFDAIHVQHLRMAQYLEMPHRQRAILDLPDAFSLYWERRRSTARPWYQRWFDGMEHRRVAAYEQILHRYPLNLVCSVEDLAYLRRTQAGAHIELLPNGVDTQAFPQRPKGTARPGRILFTGNMDYAPNVDAVRYFALEVFPLIRKAVPDACFIIAGQRPVDAVRALAGPGIEVTGFIPDLSATYAEAAVVVAPMRFGAGTQNKVLEAMSTGVPVVCSPLAFKGLGIEEGQGVVQAEDTEAFAHRVISLLQDPESGHALGERGASVIRERFSWETIAARLESFLREVAAD